MPVPTTAAVTAAARDADLRERFIAAAALADVPNPETFVDGNRYALATAPVNDQGDTVASVLDYARQNYKPFIPNSIPPGEDPSAITDAFLDFAVQYVREIPPSN